MAYNNGFPMNYQYYPQYQMQNVQPVQQTQPQHNTGIIWVQGEAGAKSYLVAPNNTVQLWDSEKQVIYLKSADASGMPSMRILDYTIRDTSTQNIMTAAQQIPQEYVTKDELNAFRNEIAEQLKKLKEKEDESAL